MDEYFNLLFEGGTQKKLPQLHKLWKEMKSSKMEEEVMNESHLLQRKEVYLISTMRERAVKL
jgi:hypothetical protein